jgi:hypothetical protein
MVDHLVRGDSTTLESIRDVDQLKVRRRDRQSRLDPWGVGESETNPRPDDAKFLL